MTTITLPRATVEQALEALKNAEDHLPKPYSTDASEAAAALRAALAQQAEAVKCKHHWVSTDGMHPGEIRCIDCGAWARQRIESQPMPMNKGCRVCGIGADGKAYGYVCPRSDCPTKVTCGGVA